MSYSFGPAFKLKNGPNSLSMAAMCSLPANLCFSVPVQLNVRLLICDLFFLAFSDYFSSGAGLIILRLLLSSYIYKKNTYYRRKKFVFKLLLT